MFLNFAFPYSILLLTIACLYKMNQEDWRLCTLYFMPIFISLLDQFLGTCLNISRSKCCECNLYFRFSCSHKVVQAVLILIRFRSCQKILQKLFLSFFHPILSFRRFHILKFIKPFIGKLSHQTNLFPKIFSLGFGKAQQG